jgi:hypothetical protein
MANNLTQKSRPQAHKKDENPKTKTIIEVTNERRDAALV